MRKRTGGNLICETCLKEFYVPKARITQAIKLHCKVRFCSAKCRNREGSNNPNFGNHYKLGKPNNTFPKGEFNPQFIKCNLSTYIGKTKRWWKNYLIDKFPKCQLCDFVDKRLLILHHIDYNIKNNVEENLLLLCPNCHALTHYETRTGPYVRVAL